MALTSMKRRIEPCNSRLGMFSTSQYLDITSTLRQPCVTTLIAEYSQCGDSDIRHLARKNCTDTRCSGRYVLKMGLRPIQTHSCWNEHLVVQRSPTPLPTNGISAHRKNNMSALQDVPRRFSDHGIPTNIFQQHVAYITVLYVLNVDSNPLCITPIVPTLPRNPK